MGMIIFFSNKTSGELWRVKESRHIQKKTSLKFLLYFFILFGIGAGSAFQYFPIDKVSVDSKTLLSSQGESIHETVLVRFKPLSPTEPYKYNKFVFYLLFLALLVWTGLIFYPFVLLISLWQYRDSQVKTYNPEQFELKAHFRWQTFAYPLPGLRGYLFRLGKDDVSKALEAIQEVQLWTLQMYASAIAARDLAKDGDTAIAFCGQIAIQSNNTTTQQLSRTGNIGCSIAILAKSLNSEQSLELLIAAEDKGWILEGWISEDEELKEIYKKSLSERLKYAQQILSYQDYEHFTHFADYKSLLDTLQSCANVKSIKEMSGISLPSHNPSGWMQQGWKILQTLTSQVEVLSNYDSLLPEKRRILLEKVKTKLKAIQWHDLSEYWLNVANELKEHWEEQIACIQKVLGLDVDITPKNIVLGERKFHVSVHNPFNETVSDVELEVKRDKKRDKKQGISWLTTGGRDDELEAGADINIPIKGKFKKTGEFNIAVTLKASLPDKGDPSKDEREFQISVNKGQAYKKPNGFIYHMSGSGLSGEALDHHFVGRDELLEKLVLYTRDAHSIVLFGQRRIGKTSLLRKIEKSHEKWKREHKIIPVFMDAQPLNSEGDFFEKASREIRNRFGIKAHGEIPTTWKKFDDFLTQEVQTRLEDCHILLMVDEAVNVFKGELENSHFTDLRSLIQEPNQLIFLFCGTYALKRAYDSGRYLNDVLDEPIAVNYLSYEESKALLTKPAKNILEFEEFILKRAYSETNGQPLLLQKLGAKLIVQFNQSVDNGLERSKRVDKDDLDEAINALIEEEGNNAFSNPWNEEYDAEKRHVLTVLAKKVEEHKHPQNIEDILSSLANFDLSREAIEAVLLSLVKEEILKQQGNTYDFVVPLYRQWITQWK